jgi:hypothetical protein
MGLHWPSRDVPAPRPIRLATAKRPRAGTLPLGTCASSGSDPTLRPVQCDSDLFCHLDFGVTTIITSRVVMRGSLAYVSGMSHQFPPRSAVATIAVSPSWVRTMRERLPKRWVPSPSPLLFKC